MKYRRRGDCTCGAFEGKGMGMQKVALISWIRALIEGRDLVLTLGSEHRSNVPFSLLSYAFQHF